MERRTKEGYKLRVYMAAIAEVKAMTNDQWIESWTSKPTSDVYTSRLAWLKYLEECALIEAEKMAIREAA